MPSADSKGARELGLDRRAKDAECARAIRVARRLHVPRVGAPDDVRRELRESAQPQRQPQLRLEAQPILHAARVHQRRVVGAGRVVGRRAVLVDPGLRARLERARGERCVARAIDLPQEPQRPQPLLLDGEREGRQALEGVGVHVVRAEERLQRVGLRRRAVERLVVARGEVALGVVGLVIDARIGAQIAGLGREEVGGDVAEVVLVRDRRGVDAIRKTRAQVLHVRERHLAAQPAMGAVALGLEVVDEREGESTVRVEAGRVAQLGVDARAGHAVVRARIVRVVRDERAIGEQLQRRSWVQPSEWIEGSDVRRDGVRGGGEVVLAEEVPRRDRRVPALVDGPEERLLELEAVAPGVVRLRQEKARLPVRQRQKDDRHGQHGHVLDVERGPGEPRALARLHQRPARAHAPRRRLGEKPRTRAVARRQVQPVRLERTVRELLHHVRFQGQLVLAHQPHLICGPRGGHLRRRGVALLPERGALEATGLLLQVDVHAQRRPTQQPTGEEHVPHRHRAALLRVVVDLVGAQGERALGERGVPEQLGGAGGGRELERVGAGLHRARQRRLGRDEQGQQCGSAHARDVSARPRRATNLQGFRSPRGITARWGTRRPLPTHRAARSTWPSA